MSDDKGKQYPWSNGKDVRACPFCGEVWLTGGTNQYGDPAPDDQFWVECQGCGVTGVSRFNTIEEAIEAWNRRASDAEIARLAEEKELAMKALEWICENFKNWVLFMRDWVPGGYDPKNFTTYQEREKFLKEFALEQAGKEKP